MGGEHGIVAGMSNGSGPVIHEDWEMYVTATEEGTPCFVSFDVQAATEDLSATLRHNVRVTVALKEPTEEGLASQAEHERQMKLLDGLAAALGKAKVRCRLVGRLTHSGSRELVFQTDDKAKFVETLKAWAQALEGEEVNLEEDEGWEYFDDVVKPGPDEWEWIADRTAVNELLEAGSDPTRPHLLQYRFGGEAPALEKVRDALLGKGYEVLAGPEEDVLVMGVKCKLDLDAISEHSLQNRDLAEAAGLSYEGWAAEVVE